MPPKRRPTRSHQLHPQPFQSDYDTEDPHNITDTPSALPTSLPPDRTNTELNLLVLRRYCPEISRILTIAPFSVVYIFSPDSQAWEKCGIEGTLFINKLETPDGGPRYNIMILNRKSMDNFMTDLTSADDIDITDEYVILQAKGGEEQTLQIYGLWIFSEIAEHGMSTKDIVGGAVRTCAAQVQAYRANVISDIQYPSDMVEVDSVPYGSGMFVNSPPQPVQQTTIGSTLDLLQLFGKAAPQSATQASAQIPPTQQMYTHSYPVGVPPNAEFSQSPNVYSVGQARQAPPDRNVLLDLFKSAG